MMCRNHYRREAGQKLEINPGQALTRSGHVIWGVLSRQKYLDDEKTLLVVMVGGGNIYIFFSNQHFYSAECVGRPR